MTPVSTTRTDYRVSIVVVAFGAPAALRDTLTSVFAHAGSGPREVIVVDNGADTVSVADLVAEFPATYIPAPNRGFGVANNIGIRHARAPFIAMLNPDVVLHDDAIGRLVELLCSDAKIGCAGPLLLRPDGSVQPYAFGWEPTPGYLLRRGLRRLAGRREATVAVVDQARQPIDVDWVAGTFLVTRAETLAAVGLLDERFFLYWEDVDWCMRVRRGGWRVVCDPRVSITHVGGASTGSSAPAHYYRSLVRFYRKWYGAPAALPLALFLKLYGPTAAAIRRLRAYRH